MGELESLVLVRGGPNNALESRGKFSGQYAAAEMMPFMSLVQEERLNVCIDKLKEAYDANKINDVTTSAVIELYEYKVKLLYRKNILEFKNIYDLTSKQLAAIRNAERANQASLEAANNRVTSLQHQLAQVVAESRKLHQLLFRSQQSLEILQKEKVAFTNKIQEVEKESKRTYALHTQVNYNQL